MTEPCCWLPGVMRICRLGLFTSDLTWTLMMKCYIGKLGDGSFDILIFAICKSVNGLFHVIVILFSMWLAVV